MEKEERDEPESEDRLLVPESAEEGFTHESEEPEGTRSPGPSTGALDEADERGDVEPDAPRDESSGSEGG
jgi:hypothetical protein